MALSIVIEDGTVVTGANAYEAVADVDTWLSDRDFSAFPDASSAQQTADLIEATRLVEDVWGGFLGGDLVNEDQPLLWPRDSAIDWRGDYIDSDVIPEGWKAAIRIVADRRRAAITASKRLEDRSKLAGVRSIALRDVKVEFSGDGAVQSLSVAYPEAWRYAKQAMPEVLRLRRA